MPSWVFVFVCLCVCVCVCVCVCGCVCVWVCVGVCVCVIFVSQFTLFAVIRGVIAVAKWVDRKRLLHVIQSRVH